MKFFCLIIFTISIVSLQTYAEVPYAQKILLKAEFDRSEVILQKQVDKIKRMRTNISTGKTYFEEVRHWNENVFVYSLETLHQSNKKDSFLKLVQILNNTESRNLVYYPVRVSDGIAGKHTKYVAFGEEECINPIEKGAIKKGTIFDIDKAALSHLSIGDTSINISHRDNNTTSIAHFTLPDDSEIFKIAMSYQSMSTDFAGYYNCRYVNEFKNLEAQNRKLLRRYGELSRILNLPTKDFSGEKKERTLTEELNELSSTMPKDTDPILAPKETKEVKATP